MRTWLNSLLIAACLALMTALTPHYAYAVDKITFGIVGTSDATQNVWTPLLAALSRALSIPVEIKLSEDYAGIIRGVQNGQIDVAMLGNESAIKAVDAGATEIFAKHVFRNGLDEYYSILIVKKSSSLNSVEDVFANAGSLTLAMGDVNSTSGYLVPSYALFDRYKIVPRKAFLRGSRGNHEQNIRAVVDGAADVATVSSAYYDRLIKAHPDWARALRVIWTSPPIPSDPLVWRKNLPAETKAKIKDFFLTYGVTRPGKNEKDLTEERNALENLDVSKFVASDNAQLLPVRLIELYKIRQTIEEDTQLPPASRRQKLELIEQQMESLSATAHPSVK